MIASGGWGSNSYVVEDEVLCVVDPGTTEDFGIAPDDVRVVVNTHNHPDHTLNNCLFQNAVVLVHPADVPKGAGQMPAELVLGSTRWRVLHTPGHTPGSLCLYEPRERVLISGDTVFAEGVGRTDFPSGNFKDLVRSIELLAGLDVRVVLPGHGEPAGSDAIRQALVFVRGF